MKQGGLFLISLIVVTSLFDTISQLMLKSSINSVGFSTRGIKKIISSIIRLVVIPRVWAGFLFCIVSLAVWLFVLSKAELNFAFSVDSMHYIFIAFASRIILKERVGILRWLGTVLIVIGITLVALSS